MLANSSLEKQAMLVGETTLELKIETELFASTWLKKLFSQIYSLSKQNTTFAIQE